MSLASSSSGARTRPRGSNSCTSGQGDGEGLVEWTAQQKARHRARDGGKEPHMQVLEFVIKEGDVSAQTAGAQSGAVTTP